jgi:F-type H+-transporting ATPase subunit delta
VNPTLQGYTAAVAEAAEAAAPGALGPLAADLEAIEQLVLANAQLRAALTDTAVPGPARRAVVLDLLDGKVSPEARRLAAFASMVVGAPEVPAALGWVSTHVRHLSEGQDDEPNLSLTQARQRVGGFATAVHEDMSTAELESLEDDLFRFARIVGATPDLRSALTNRDLEVAARQGLVTQLLEGKVPAAALSLARYAVTGGRARDIVGTLDFLVELTAQARGWRIARVRAAAPIDDAQRGELTDSLGTLAGAPVELQVELDESLLSGALIRIGDLQVDATARGRIDALREHFNPEGWQPTGFARSHSQGHSSNDDTEGAQ